MQLIEVNNAATARDFIKVNVLMNRNDPNYIRPLDKEVNEGFDAKSKNLKYGEAKRWILKDDNNKLIGRIAAFTNSNYKNKGTEYATGGIGYFDCINDDNAAKILFDAAKQWLQSKGMEAMDGPINFVDRDKWWGLMVEGFENPPLYGMSYNPVYYASLFENYGFRNFYNQYYYTRGVTEPTQPRFLERYERFNNKPGYAARHIDKNKLEKHAAEFATVYNAAWAQHEEGKQISAKDVMKIFDKIKPVLDERIVWFAYYKEEPIAMWVNIPDFNEYFKHFNGKFGLMQKLRMLWMKKTNQCRIFTGIAFGVVPKFQALGIDSYLIHAASLIVQPNGGIYDKYEMGWTGDWNPKMINIYKTLGRQSRRMVTYRYIFDETKHPFERHPVMEYK